MYGSDYSKCRCCFAGCWLHGRPNSGVAHADSKLNGSNYDPAVMLAWQANVDVQFVLNAYACVVYIS